MIYVHLATGFEEIEALTVTDILRRAGADMKTVSVTGEKTVEGAHGIGIMFHHIFCRFNHKSFRHEARRLFPRRKDG